MSGLQQVPVAPSRKYRDILAKPEEFRQAEKTLLYGAKMEESEISAQKAQEILTAIQAICNLKSIIL